VRSAFYVLRMPRQAMYDSFPLCKLIPADLHDLHAVKANDGSVAMIVRNEKAVLYSDDGGITVALLAIVLNIIEVFAKFPHRCSVGRSYCRAERTAVVPAYRKDKGGALGVTPFFFCGR